MHIRHQYDLKADRNKRPETKVVLGRVTPKPKQDTKYLIEGLLGEFDSLALEGDGFTRVAHYTLHNMGVDHRCFCGRCTVGETVVPLHYWIVAGEYTVDYRLRMWAGNDAPHGVFDTKLFPDVEYVGEQVLLPMSAVIFEILTGIS